MLAHLAQRCLGRPLLAEPEAAARLLGVLAEKLDLATIEMAGCSWSAAELRTDAQGRGRRPREYRVDGGVAVVPVIGSLVSRSTALQPASGLTGYTAIGEALDQAIADPEVASVLLELDSPGGEAAGAFELARRVRAAAAIKPVWASANEEAFSAAFALASAASRITLPRSASVGSIGVIAAHVDQTGELARRGRKVTIVRAGARKAEGNPFEPLTAEVAAQIQAAIDDLYGQFVDLVATHRQVEPAAVRATEGATLRAPDALRLRLADAIQPFAETLAELQALSPAPATRPAPTNRPAQEPTMHAMPATMSVNPPTDEAAARMAERNRIAAILDSPNAQDRPVMARYLALQSDVPPEVAAGILAQAPKEAAAAADRGGFLAMMDRLGNPQIGPGQDAGDDVAAAAARIAAYSKGAM